MSSHVIVAEGLPYLAGRDKSLPFEIRRDCAEIDVQMPWRKARMVYYSSRGATAAVAGLNNFVKNEMVKQGRFVFIDNEMVSLNKAMTTLGIYQEFYEMFHRFPSVDNLVYDVL
jgi:hypothetical protein